MLGEQVRQRKKKLKNKTNFTRAKADERKKSAKKDQVVSEDINMMTGLVIMPMMAVNWQATQIIF